MPDANDPLDGLGTCYFDGKSCSARWQFRFDGAARILPPAVCCGYKCAGNYVRAQGVKGKFGMKRELTVLGRREPARP